MKKAHGENVGIQVLETQDENRILFFHYPSTKLLSINVPRHLATESFKREVRTARFITVSLDYPDVLGEGNQVRVTFDDSSSTPFCIGASCEDFRTKSTSKGLQLLLPTNDNLRAANVIVYDEAIEAQVKSGHISAKDALKTSLIWAGKAETKIKLSENEYTDGKIKVVMY